MVYNGTQYRYITNPQGDIVEIRDANDSTVVTYTYDAWGKLLDITGTKANDLGVHNPLRYRGYVYDTETGLYYLQSRYYNPTIGRFISADVLVSTGQGQLGNNMFAYCRNNPVNRRDVSGTTDESVSNFAEDDSNPHNDIGGPSGKNGGASGKPTNNSNSDGLQGNDNSSSVKDYLIRNGQNPNKILESFEGEPQLKVLTEDTTVYRVWGGQASQYGHWVSPNNYGDAARSLLALPPGNTMMHTSSFVIPCGTTVLAGVASPYFGQPGGGIQWWVVRVAF